jgi:hypothetical protein
MMTVLERIKSFFRWPRTKTKAEGPKVTAETAEKKPPEAPEKKI